MTTKNFCCPYMGKNGKTVRGRVKLANLADLIPAIGDNEHCATPLWYEVVGDRDYEIYAQLSDRVAADTCFGVSDYELENYLRKSEAEIDKEYTQKIRERLASEDNDTLRIERLRKYWVSDKLCRKEKLAEIKSLQNYTSHLLQGNLKCSYTILAYEEVQSPDLPALEELHRRYMARREEEIRRREEEIRRREEEERRREEEEKAKERQRLTEEAEKFKHGESIAGGDVAELCRCYGINVHPRTMHNLQQVIQDFTPAGTCHYYYLGGREPVLDGCFKAATELYNYLQTHDVL